MNISRGCDAGLMLKQVEYVLFNTYWSSTWRDGEEEAPHSSQQHNETSQTTQFQALESLNLGILGYGCVAGSSDLSL